MQALVLEEINNYILKDVKIPDIEDSEVLVNVKACGICGSDIPRVYQNGAHKMPLIIGHEFSGIVSKSKSNLYKAGDRVGIFPLIPCKKCMSCRASKYEMCRDYNYLGSRTNGGFAEYVKVPEWNLIKLPDKVSYEWAAMLEPMAVAVHAMRQLNDMDKGDSIAIYGMGTIGLLLSLFLRNEGYNNLYLIGNKDFQLKTIINLGFDKESFCDSRKIDVKDFINQKTNGEGVNHFFECIGKSETIENAIDLTIAGGSICLVGNPYTDVTLSKAVYWKILRNQIKISGTWNSSFTHDSKDDWNYVLRCLENGDINPNQLITHKYGIENLKNGFEIMNLKLEDYIKIMMVNE